MRTTTVTADRTARHTAPASAGRMSRALVAILVVVASVTGLFAFAPRSDAATPAAPLSADELTAALRHRLAALQPTAPPTPAVSPTVATPSTAGTTTAPPTATGAPHRPLAAPPAPPRAPTPSTTTPSTITPPTTTPSTTTPPTTAPPKTAPRLVTPKAGTDTFALAQPVIDFFTSGLKLDGVGTTLQGTIDPSGVFTTTLASPSGLPVTLPGDLGTVRFTGVSLSIATTKTLTITVSATIGSANVTVTVTIAKADTLANATDLAANLTGTVSITGIPALGGTVDVSGTVAYSAGQLSGSFTGAVTADITLPGSVVITKGSTITLTSAGTFSVDGTLRFPIGANTVDLHVTGTYQNTKTWSLDVQQTGGGWSPVSGLTLAPNITGHIDSNAGAITFDVTDGGGTTWQPTTGFSLRLDSVEVANVPPAAALPCPTIPAGNVWVSIAGTATVDVPGASSFSLATTACIDPKAGAFKITTVSSAAGTLYSSPGLFSIDRVGFTVVREAGKPVSFTAAARATVKTTVINVGVAFHSDRSFVASVALSPSDLSTLGLTGSSATLFVATADINGYNPQADFADQPASSFDLKQGVDVRLVYSIDASTRSKLSSLLNVVVPQNATATATLGTTGFGLTLGIDMPSGGAQIFNLKGVTLSLTSVNVGLTVGTSVSATISANANLHIPSIYNGTPDSNLAVKVSAGIDLASTTVSLGFSASGTWYNAFGIPGMQVGALGASFGFNFATLLPTISVSATGVVLPSDWAKAIGMDPGSTMSLDLSTNAAQPFVHLSFTGGIYPLKWVPGASPAAISAFSGSQLEVYVAPAGGVTATGVTLNPGIDLTFKGVVLSRTVSVHAAVSLAPWKLDANLTFGPLQIGSAYLPSTTLAIHFGGDGFSFTFAGGFSDGRGNSFDVVAKLNASAGLVGGSIDLSLKAGLPSYLYAAGQFHGSISSTGFSASGSGSIYVAGTYLGAVSFTYSVDYGMGWQQISGSAAQVASYLKTYYGYTADQIQAALTSLKWNSDQVISALTTLGTYGQQFVTAVTNLFHTGKEYVWNGALVWDVYYASQDPNTPVIQYFWNGGKNQQWMEVPTGEGGGWIYFVNVNSGQCLTVGGAGDTPGSRMVQWPCIGSPYQKFYKGSDGSILVQGPWLHGRPLYLDIQGNSKSPGAALDDWWWNGGSNQYFSTTWAA